MKNLTKNLKALEKQDLESRKLESEEAKILQKDIGIQVEEVAKAIGRNETILEPTDRTKLLKMVSEIAKQSKIRGEKGEPMQKKPFNERLKEIIDIVEAATETKRVKQATKAIEKQISSFKTEVKAGDKISPI